MSDHTPPHGLYSKHRLEALIDGTFAIAITLLVLELKLPDHTAIKTAAELHERLLHLLPKIFSWVLSFMVLSIFFLANKRIMRNVRWVDTRLSWLSLMFLMGVSFLPFSSALIGEFPGAFVSQLIYALNMAAIAAMNLWSLNYVQGNPSLSHHLMPEGTFRAARFRITGLMVVAVAAIGVAWFAPHFASASFALMILIGRASRRIEAKYNLPASPAATTPASPESTQPAATQATKAE